MSLTPDLKAARHAYSDALSSGCSMAVTVPLGREMARLEQAAESTDERCFRLGFEAVAHDKHAEDLRSEAQQDRHLADARRGKWGADDETALRIERRAVIGEEMAAKAEAEAVRLRSQCAALRRAANRTIPQTLAAE